MVSLKMSVNKSKCNEKSERAIWSEPEVRLLIAAIRDHDIMKALDGKRYRNAEIYKTLVPVFAEHGYRRTYEQIRSKWKALCADYRAATGNNSRSGSGTSTCPFFDELQVILGARPSVRLIAEGVDSSSAVDVLVEPDVDSVLPLGEFTFNTPGTSCQDESSSISLPSTPSPLLFDSSPIASSSSLGSVGLETQRRQRKRKATYGATLATVSQQLDDTNKEIRQANKDHHEMMKKEFATQREWEENQLQISRKANAKLLKNTMAQMANTMALFFAQAQQGMGRPNTGLLVDSSDSE